MGVDFDLSYFRLVKSFAAVEISRNIGASAADETVRSACRCGGASIADPSPARVNARDPVRAPIDRRRLRANSRQFERRHARGSR